IALAMDDAAGRLPGSSSAQSPTALSVRATVQGLSEPWARQHVGRRVMSTRVVAISRTTGSGGESIGRIVSERLGFRYVDEEIVAWTAEKAGVEPDLVADAERRKGLLARFIEGLGKSGVDAGI